MSPTIDALGFFGEENHQTNISLIIRVISTTIFFYNFFLTIDDEVEYIWIRTDHAMTPPESHHACHHKGRILNWCTLVYVVTKYLSAICLIVTLSQTGFNRVLKAYLSATDQTTIEIYLAHFPVVVVTHMGAVILFFAMILLQIRVRALYAATIMNRRTLLWIFSILNFISVVAFILLVILKKDTIDMLGVMESTTNGQPYPCNYTPLFWAPFFVNETISFLMISYKAWEDRRTDGPCRKGIGNTIVTHNIVYYFIITVVFLFGLGITLQDNIQENLNKDQLLPYCLDYLLFCIAITGILAPNLFLELRKSYHNQTLAPVSMVTLPIEFRRPTEVASRKSLDTV